MADYFAGQKFFDFYPGGEEVDEQQEEEVSLKIRRR